MNEDDLHVDEEFNRLDTRLDELVEKIHDADDPAAFEQIAATVETQLSGVAYMREEYGLDATVTVKGLTAGDMARVEDGVAKRREERGQQSLPGIHKMLFAAAGIVDAPFVEPDASFEERVETLADQPVGVREWIRAQVNDKTTVSAGNWTGLDERLAER